MTERSLVFAVRRCEADYFRSARLDDALQICTRGLKTTGASPGLNSWLSGKGLHRRYQNTAGMPEQK